MGFFRIKSEQLTDYFIGDLLANTNDTLERSKIEMLYWFYILSIFQLSSFLPFLIKDGNFVATVSILFSILILVSSLFYIRIFKIYKPLLIVIAISSPLLTLSIIPILMPQDLSVLMTIIYITLSLVIFTLDKKWAFLIVFLTICTIGFTAYLKSIGVQSGGLLGINLTDPTILDFSSVVKNGMPMILLTLAIANFVRINRQTNDELISSREQFKTLVEGAEDLVYELTSDGQFKYANPAFLKVTGYSPDFLIGSEYINLIHPKSADKVRRYFVEAEYEIPDNSYVEIPIITKNNETIWIGQKVNYVFDESGKLTKYLCISRDITQQKETTANLEKAKTAAEKAATIKAQFLSAMSHEIRTPINAVLGSIHLMADENPRVDQVPHLNTMKFSAENLMNLVSRILDFNHLESGEITLKNIPFSLMECLNQAKAGLEQFANDKEIDFSIEIDPKLPEKLVGDPFRISQVLNNIAHNGIKFTPSGSVVIRVSEHQTANDHIEVLFSVADTGKGISEGKLDAVFQKFTQATDDTVLEGTGLGLAISSKIVALLNSRIKVQSIKGKGSTFSFILNLKKVKEGISTINPSQKGLQIKTQNKLEESLLGINILLVEDNIINQKVASKILSRWGANITIAQNGQIAVDEIQENDYDVVLMDIQMPVMNGIKATTIIRTLGGKYAKIPIIALTASAVLEVRQNAMEAGLNDFLTKPFKPENLNKTILKQIGIRKKQLDETIHVENIPEPGD